MPSNKPATSDLHESDERVVLYQYSKTENSPNTSPFCVMIESYLRLHDIPYTPKYQPDIKSPLGIPSILHRREEFRFTRPILKHLDYYFKVHMDDHLAEDEKAIALAFTHMIESHLYYCAQYELFINDHSFTKYAERYMDQSRAPKWYSKQKAVKAKKKAMRDIQGQGLGNKPWHQVKEEAEELIKVLAAKLGDNRFFMGDTISTVDLSLFGFLVATCYSLYVPEITAIVREYRNLVHYATRMMEKIFPDFDSTPPAIREEVDPNTSKMNIDQGVTLSRSLSRPHDIANEEDIPPVPNQDDAKGDGDGDAKEDDKKDQGQPSKISGLGNLLRSGSKNKK